MAHIDNTTTFEKSALQQLLVKGIPPMDAFSMNQLVGPVAEHASLSATLGATCEIAKQMRWQGVLFKAGSIIFIGGSAMEIKGCIRTGTDFGFLACKFGLVEQSGTHSRWMPTASVELVSPQGARRSLGWFRSADNTIVVLH